MKKIQRKECLDYELILEWKETLTGEIRIDYAQDAAGTHHAVLQIAPDGVKMLVQTPDGKQIPHLVFVTGNHSSQPIIRQLFRKSCPQPNNLPCLNTQNRQPNRLTVFVYSFPLVCSASSNSSHALFDAYEVRAKIK